MAVGSFKDSFCGGTDIWNTTEFETSTWPRFTQCFRHTLITWVPCGYLILIFPFHLSSLYSKPRTVTQKIPLSYLSIAKLTLCVVLAVVNATYLINILSSHYDKTRPDIAIIVSLGLQILTFLLAGILSQVQRIKGKHSSWILFIFWVSLALVGIIPFYTKIILKEYVDRMFGFVMYLVYYGIVLVQVVLHCFSEKKIIHTQLDKDPCPKSTASVLNHLYFCWMNSLVIKAHRQPLEENDLWSLLQKDQSRVLSSSFDKEWTKETNGSKISEYTESHDSNRSSNGNNAIFTSNVHLGSTEKTPLLGSNTSVSEKPLNEPTTSSTPRKRCTASLNKVLCKTYGCIFLKSLTFKFVSDVLQFVNPILLGVIIDYADNKASLPLWRGYMPALGMFVCTVVQSACYQQNYYYSLGLGMKIKSTLITAIYKKSLTMDNDMRKGTTQGETANLMAVDCQRIQDAFTLLWSVMTVPLQTFLGLYLLWGVVGPSSLAGLAVLLLLVPFNSLVAIKQRKLQAQVLRYKGQRIKLLNELINAIKVIKMYAWEPPFQDKVLAIRNNEIKRLLKIAYLQGFSTFCWLFAPFLVTLATFASYVCVSDTHTLRPADAFVALSLFNVIRTPISLISTLISYVVQALASLERIKLFLCGTDLDPRNVDFITEGENAIAMNHGTFTWDKDMPQATLRDIDFKISEGQFVAVVGQVGSGKSSMISAMLGEMRKLQGSVAVKGKVAYVPQQAWIQNDTLKDNVLFEKPMLNKKYQRVMEACALVEDLDALPGRDLTEIGEKGFNISEGQKQRVSLARAVYSNSDVYLMDDPLSAVDSHVEKHIFNKVFGPKGLLKNKTRVLVTHGIHWLPMVDNIIVMANGRVSEMGSYEELISHDGPFAQFLKQCFLEEEDGETEDDAEIQDIKDKMYERIESVTSEGTSAEESSPKSSPKLRRRNAMKRKKKEERDLSKESTGSETKLLSKPRLTHVETSQLGRVRCTVVGTYARAVGILATIVLFVAFSCYHGASIFANYWLTFWTEDAILANTSQSHTQEYNDRSYTYLKFYAVLGIIQGFLVLIYGLLASVRMVYAAGKLHDNMLASILRSSMLFFDTTPVGKIINRFSSDVDTMDNHLPLAFRVAMNTVFWAAGTVIVVSVNTPMFLTVVVPAAIVYFIIMKFFIPTSRQLKRLESVSRSPVFNHFSETITGASVIRAFRATERFIDELMRKVDTNQVYYFASFCSARWLGTRLDFLGNCLILSAALFGIFSPLNGAVVGLSIFYALQATGILNLLVVNLTDLQNHLVSIERIKEYTEVPSEAQWRTENRPATQWPTQGKISFTAYKTRYRPDLDLVLRGVNADIEHNEKIGIVGRTGAGKSSLTLSLFRLIEAAGGSIIIDGVRIADIGLHDLREKITILPQDPVLFTGTLRMNLDPFDQYSEDQLWQSLEHAHLKEFVSTLPERLDYECGEGGQNLSVGQRQLVCLARTLLKPTKILILDYATAAVDMQTDELIQETVRSKFQDCTVLFIAHRPNTVMDYDRVMVLDNGQIWEFDTPSNLLDNRKSIFHGMAKEAGLLNSDGSGPNGNGHQGSGSTYPRRLLSDDNADVPKVVLIDNDEDPHRSSSDIEDSHKAQVVPSPSSSTKSLETLSKKVTDV